MGFYPPYILFSFQHATGSWTADPQGNFPSFVAFCSPTLHDKDIDLSDFYDHTRALESWRSQATPIHDSITLAQSGMSLHNFREPASTRSNRNPVTIPSTRYPLAALE